MKILFVSSGNSSAGISPIILNQGKSLSELGHEVSYFTNIGKGFKGYIENIFRLRRYLQNESFDVVHAHYSLSGVVAAFAGAKPLVISLMGSDVKASGYFKYILQFFSRFYWDTIIVKSNDMRLTLGIKGKPIHVIPNGVNFERFQIFDRKVCLAKTDWDPHKTHILFAADPSRYEKNFAIAQGAFELIESGDVELHYLKNIPNDEIPYYMGAADIVLLTSLWEGSPNVIKEAMACSRPIVATDVGDIKDLIKKTSGCYVTSFNKVDIAKKIEKALKYKRTSGREDIGYLESSIIGKRIIDLYHSNLN